MLHKQKIGGYYMESLKTKLRRLRKLAKERYRKAEKEKLNSLKRSDDEWKVIDNHLSIVVTRAVENSRGSRVIRIDSNSTVMESLFYKQGDDLHTDVRCPVTHEDMRRFCKEHRLKLRYMYKNDYGYEIVKKVKTNYFSGTYLIKV